MKQGNSNTENREKISSIAAIYKKSNVARQMKLFLSEIVGYSRYILAKSICRLSYGGIAAAFIIGLTGLIIFLSGNASWLNHLLGSSTDIIFGSPLYRPDISPEIIKNLLVKYYLIGLVIISISLTILAFILVHFIISVLSFIGQLILVGVFSFVRGDRLQIMFITNLAVWTFAIFSTWLVLNGSGVINYLLAECGLLVINLLLSAMSFRSSKVIADSLSIGNPVINLKEDN